METLTNKTNYLTELLVWQNATPSSKAKRSKHMSERPQPFVPAFMKGSQPASEVNKGSVKRTVDDVKSILALPRG